jgi:hypothetical protein
MRTDNLQPVLMMFYCAPSGQLHQRDIYIHAHSAFCRCWTSSARVAATNSNTALLWRHAYTSIGTKAASSSQQPTSYLHPACCLHGSAQRPNPTYILRLLHACKRTTTHIPLTSYLLPACKQAREQRKLPDLHFSLQERRDLFESLDLIPPEYTYEASLKAIALEEEETGQAGGTSASQALPVPTPGSKRPHASGEEQGGGSPCKGNGDKKQRTRKTNAAISGSIGSPMHDDCGLDTADMLQQAAVPRCVYKLPSVVAELLQRYIDGHN